MSKLKVDKLEPRSVALLEIDKAKLQNGSVIDLEGGTNLGTAAGHDDPYFIKAPAPAGNAGNLLKVLENGQVEATAITPADVSEVISKVPTLEGAVASLASGGPKGIFADSAALVSTNPDHAYVYLVIADNKWWYHDGANWVAGGLYQDSAAFNELAGPTRSTETVVQNAIDIAEHKDSPTPHKITDGVTTWKYGLGIVNLRGFRHLQLVIEEVV